MAKRLMSVILAAGESEQMQSNLPKAMHTVCGKPMVSYVLDAAKQAGSEKEVMVVGFGREKLKQAFGDQVCCVVQEHSIGTGDAVACARSQFEQFDGLVLVLPSDTPLIDAGTLKGAVAFHEEFQNEATVITAVAPDPEGYGRVIRNGAGDVVSIVEQKLANQSELEISEINSGIFIFNAAALCYALDHIDSLRDDYDKANLIHSIEVLIKSGRRVGAYDADDAECVRGVNNRIQLFEAEAVMRSRINREHMLRGVTIMAPADTYIEKDVIIGRDTVIFPNVHLRGKTKIGENVTVGANTIIRDSQIEDGVDILNSVILDSYVDAGAHIGPFAYLRPNSSIGKNVKIGDFVEIKNATLDEGTKVSHLTYVGDADVGKAVNFGCGCVTVNYDGAKKYRTTVGDHAFIGCNTNLVSPVHVHDNAYIAAGSTITDEVPESALAIARSRQVNKLNWNDRRNQKK